MPKNVENFEIRTLGRDDYAQAAGIFAFVHALHQANRPDIYRKTNVPLGEDEFFKMCDDPHEIMLCAVRDGKILGLARTVMRGSLGVRNSRPERTGRSPWARSSDTRSVFCARAFSSGVK